MKISELIRFNNDSSMNAKSGGLVKKKEPPRHHQFPIVEDVKNYLELTETGEREPSPEQRRKASPQSSLTKQGKVNIVTTLASPQYLNQAAAVNQSLTVNTQGTHQSTDRATPSLSGRKESTLHQNSEIHQVSIHRQAHTRTHSITPQVQLNNNNNETMLATFSNQIGTASQITRPLYIINEENNIIRQQQQYQQQQRQNNLLPVIAQDNISMLDNSIYKSKVIFIIDSLQNRGRKAKR